MESREQLEQKLSDLEAQKEAMLANGADQAAVIRLNEDIKAVRQQLSAIDTKAAIIAGANDPESSFALTVDGYTVDFRTEAASEESYQALRIITQLKLQELEEQNQAEIKALKTSYDSERQQFELQIESLEEQRVDANQMIESSKRGYKELVDQLYNANIQISDLESKRFIAVNEIESLKAQVEELRNQVSKPNVPTNQDTASLAQAMEKLKASRPAIYNVVEISGTKSTAISVDTNETIEFHPNYIGKYRVVSHDEALQLRSELEAAEAARQADEESIPLSVEPVEVIDFRESVEAPPLSDVHIGHELDENPVEREDGQNDEGGIVTREEFEALKRRVEDIESLRSPPEQVYPNGDPMSGAAA